MDFDVIVLGAGIVGVSAALHLRDRGRRVALVDRGAPGDGTSFGNAGLIERSSVAPYAFARSPLALLRYAANRSTELYWDRAALPSFAPWLARFWWESSPRRHAAAARDMLPLIERSVAEHDALIARAGAGELVRACGWIEAYRTPARLEHATRDALLDASRHGLRVTALDAAALAAQEPALGPGFCGALHWLDPKSVVDPGALVKAYARLFARDGGTLLEGDAATLEAGDGGWRVCTAEGVAAARDVVVALGPWSDTVFAKLGYRLPLREKRGYHMHYAPPDGAPLSAPVVDRDDVRRADRRERRAVSRGAVSLSRRARTCRRCRETRTPANRSDDSRQSARVTRATARSRCPSFRSDDFLHSPPSIFFACRIGKPPVIDNRVIQRRLLPPSPNHCTLNEQCLAIFTTNVVNADRRGPLNARLIETRTTASSPIGQIGQSTRAALLKQPTLTRGETS